MVKTNTMLAITTKLVFVILGSVDIWNFQAASIVLPRFAAFSHVIYGVVKRQINQTSAF